MYIKTFADLEANLTVWKDSFEKEKASFIEKLARDPMAAMRWSAPMFQEAPRYWLATHYLNVLADRKEDIDNGVDVPSEEQALKNLRDHALRTVLSRADRVSRSSSPESNMIEAYETEAWVKLLNLFGTQGIV